MPSANITLNVGWTKCLTYSGIVRCRILGNLLPWGKIEFAHPVQVIHRVRKNVNVMLAPLLRTIRGTLDRYRLLQSVKSFIVVLLEALNNTICIIGAGVLLHKLLLVYGSRVVSPGVLVDNGGGSWAALWYGLWRDHVQWYFQHITHTMYILSDSQSNTIRKRGIYHYEMLRCANGMHTLKTAPARHELGQVRD